LVRYCTIKISGSSNASGCRPGFQPLQPAPQIGGLSLNKLRMLGHSGAHRLEHARTARNPIDHRHWRRHFKAPRRLGDVAVFDTVGRFPATRAAKSGVSAVRFEQLAAVFTGVG
jgi:hypothetical protein